MIHRYSIAAARHDLAGLVHRLEHVPAIELTRRGEPVAVLLSMQEYRRLRAGRHDFAEGYAAFRASVELAALDIGPSVFEGVRDTAPGRVGSW